ncbi:MAG: hypothetical protein K2V38_20465, partial [Gemmataceae bacterium]|nr:hypothetical protein [Gemmataceae bacterium]
DLDPAEARFTVAHELAHFLRDFDAPRRRVAARLGVAALEVLDGLRPPTADERLAGLLRGVSVGPAAHFMDRDRRGAVLDPDAREAEAKADRLAFELVAPFAAVEADAAAGREKLAESLVSRFGLPPEQAGVYTRILLPHFHVKPRLFGA